MTLVELLIALFIIFIIGFVAYWIINKFLPEPMRTPALAVVGLVLLILLLVRFFPSANVRVLP